MTETRTIESGITASSGTPVKLIDLADRLSEKVDENIKQVKEERPDLDYTATNYEWDRKQWLIHNLFTLKM